MQFLKLQVWEPWGKSNHRKTITAKSVSFCFGPLVPTDAWNRKACSGFINRQRNFRCLRKLETLKHLSLYNVVYLQPSKVNGPYYSETSALRRAGDTAHFNCMAIHDYSNCETQEYYVQFLLSQAHYNVQLYYNVH